MNKILVPVDFSDASENAVNYAIGMANFFSANIILLHVNQLPASTPEFGLGVYSFVDSKNESLEILKAKSDAIKQGNPQITSVDYYTEMGDITDLILAYTKDDDVDLVVMGNSGHGSNIQKTLFGSTSVSVSKKIEIPLIIVPPNVKYGKIKNIAYACDYDENIELSTTLIKVKYLNTIFNSTLSVLHVIPENHMLNENEATIDNFIETKLANTSHRTLIITENNVSTGILDYIKHHNIDMIIIEPKKHSLFHHLFYSSVTNELAFFSPVPVLAVHG